MDDGYGVEYAHSENGHKMLKLQSIEISSLRSMSFWVYFSVYSIKKTQRTFITSMDISESSDHSNPLWLVRRIKR